MKDIYQIEIIEQGDAYKDNELNPENIVNLKGLFVAFKIAADIGASKL